MHDTGVMHEAGDVIRRQWRDPGGRLGKQKAREGSRNNGGNQEAGEGAAGGRGEMQEVEEGCRRYGWMFC